MIESAAILNSVHFNTPSPERMRYLLDLCKEKKTAHLRRTRLETQDLLRIPLSFWEGASHQTDRGGWWARAPSEELTSVQANLASPSVGQGGLHRLQSKHTPETDLAQEEKVGKTQAPADIGHRDVLGSSGRNRKNIPSPSHLRLHPHTAPYPALFGGHDARMGYIGDRRPHQLGHSSQYVCGLQTQNWAILSSMTTMTGPYTHWWARSFVDTYLV